MCCLHDAVQCQGMHDLWHCCKWSQVITCGGYNIPQHGNKNAFDCPLFRDGWELVYDLDPWCYVALPHELVLSDHLLNMQGLMERVSDQRCQLMVVCRGAEAIVRCSPCMHAIACRGCLLASMTLLKNCTTCDYMIEHFKFV
jgi:hypothetical protein